MYNKILKTSPIKLSKDELIKVVSSTLIGWKLVDDTLVKQYTLKDYEQTWSFLNQIAMRSHLWGHHPEINTVYNKVNIRLTTHDLNSVSDIDIKLAKRIDKYREIYEKTN